MTVWDWLATPVGLDLTHAVIVVMVAAAAWLSARSHRECQDHRHQLADRIRRHELWLAELEARSRSARRSPPFPTRRDWDA